MAHFSYKQLAQYLECPLQFRKVRLEKTPTDHDPRRPFIGNLLGTLVERLYIEKWWAPPNDLLAILTREVEPLALRLEQAEGIVWPPGERTQALAIIYTTLPKIIATMKRERLLAPKVYTEYDIEIPLGADTLVGRADYVYVGGEGITVVDGKGGGSMGRHVKLNQLRFYVLGVYAKTGALPVRAGFWWFRHDFVKWHRITPANLKKFVGTLQGAIAGLRANDWTPRPGGHCLYCDVRRFCSVGQAKMLTREVSSSDPLVGKNEGFVSL